MVDLVRTPSQRKADTLRRLEHDVDCWVATAGAGAPYLIPLSYLWDGAALIVSTPTTSTTSRNLQATGQARIGIGPTRDLVLIEASAQALTAAELTGELGAAFAEKTGFDPRQLTTPYTYFRLTPLRIQAWREANELDGRTLMRDGAWLVEE